MRGGLKRKEKKGRRGFGGDYLSAFYVMNNYIEFDSLF